MIQLPSRGAVSIGFERYPGLGIDHDAPARLRPSRRIPVCALYDRDMLGWAAASLAAKLAQCIALETPVTVPGLRGDELEGLKG